MRAKLFLSLVVFCVESALLQAQFYTNGSEPTSVRWNQIETPTYKLIYPRGHDSLAVQYARFLEQTADVVGRSVGFRPNENYRRKMPVVMHTFAGYSNGMVVDAPYRLELMTLPNMISSDATPWLKHLVIHESRHAAQTQFSVGKPFRWSKILTGQLLPLAWEALYLRPEFLEGDSVVAETAFTNSGRGATADFLEYFRVSFANGDTRNFYQWRYSSQRHYTTDYYHVGYLKQAGIRTLYDLPDYTALFHKRIRDKGGISINNFNGTLRDNIGKSQRQAFNEIRDHLREQWADNDKLRAPFMDYNIVVAPNKYYYTEFTQLAHSSDELFAVREGLSLPTELVRISPDGKVRRIRDFSPRANSLQYSKPTKRLYWSEPSYDIRWELRGGSDIHFWDGKKAKRLTNGQRYYNPAPSSRSAMLAVCEQLSDGSSAVCVIDAYYGDVISRSVVPVGIQIAECVWLGDELYVSAINDDGFGIYRVSDWSCVLSHKGVKIRDLREGDGEILFTCDRTSVNELYAFQPQTGVLVQLSNTRFGASEFCFSPSRDKLYFSSPQVDGRVLSSCSSGELVHRNVSWDDITHQPMVDKLREQEQAKVDTSKPVEISSPQRYSKIGNLFKFHSWLPLYLDYDAIQNLSMSDIFNYVGLGATAFFQNDLGNAWGSVAHKANNGLKHWRSSGHLKFSYAGFFPVLEFQLHFNERNAALYYFHKAEDNSVSLRGKNHDTPLLRSSISAYIPFNFSSGGLSRGFIPKVTFSTLGDFTTATQPKKTAMTKFNANVRLYSVQSIPNSRTYPRWGIGAEVGVDMRPGMGALINPNAYLFVYGYTPGVWETHGIKLSAIHNMVVGNGLFCEAYANTLPRGMNSETIHSLANFRGQTKATIDYSIPILPIDWAIGNILYIRNLELIPHFDFAYYKSDINTGNLYSAGSDVLVRLSNLFDARIGVTYDYSGGSLYGILADLHKLKSRHSVKLKFGMSF